MSTRSTPFGAVASVQSPVPVPVTHTCHELPPLIDAFARAHGRVIEALGEFIAWQ